VQKQVRQRRSLASDSLGACLWSRGPHYADLNSQIPTSQPRCPRNAVIELRPADYHACYTICQHGAGPKDPPPAQ
jgi:hypothetical protein